MNKALPCECWTQSLEVLEKIWFEYLCLKCMYVLTKIQYDFFMKKEDILLNYSIDTNWNHQTNHQVFEYNRKDKTSNTFFYNFIFAI